MNSSGKVEYHCRCGAAVQEDSGRSQESAMSILHSALPREREVPEE